MKLRSTVNPKTVDEVVVVVVTVVDMMTVFKKLKLINNTDRLLAMPSCAPVAPLFTFQLK